MTARVLGDNRDARLGEDAHGGGNDFEFAGIGAAGVDGLVFPREKDVPLADLDKGRRRAPRAGVHHGDVREKIVEELGLLRLVVINLLRVGEGREEVPAGAAARFGIGRDDLDAALHKVAPVLETLRIPGADKEDDRRGVGRGVVRKGGKPTGVDESGLLDERDVVLQGERHNIRGSPFDDGPRLLAGAAVALDHLDAFAGLEEMDLFEKRIQRLVELARRVVAHVRERGDGRPLGAAREQRRKDQNDFRCRIHCRVSVWSFLGM